MTFFLQMLLVALAIVGSNGDETPCNSHYVGNTDNCGSQCEYYGKECPITPIMNTGPGYDCDIGHCRLPPSEDCIAVERHTVYAKNVDACDSLCKYIGVECPIRTFAPMPAGFDCKQGYCRRRNKSKCIREICYKKYEF